jgi:hypothetical protein
VGNILNSRLLGPMAWKADTMLEENGVVYLNEACLYELEQAAKVLKANPIPIIALKPDFFKYAGLQIAYVEDT